MTAPTFTFTRSQLGRLLDSTIEMFIEYRDKHDMDEGRAQFAAVHEMFNGLDATIELVALGELDKAQAGMVIA